MSFSVDSLFEKITSKIPDIFLMSQIFLTDYKIHWLFQNPDNFQNFPAFSLPAEEGKAEPLWKNSLCKSWHYFCFHGHYLMNSLFLSQN